MAQTKCTVVVEGQTVEEILSFDYSSDVLAIAEEAHFTVDNKNRKYRDLLQIGNKVQFILQHPAVNGGQPTIKHRGRIVQRKPKVTPGIGSEIEIVSGDLGWHLVNSHAPLWMRLIGKTYADICDPATSPFFDKSWDFQGVRFDGDIRRRLKLGVALAAASSQRGLDPAFVIQVEPGSAAADLISDYARRINLLLNVSPDGWVCLYRPADNQEPLYSIRCRSGDPDNNVLEAEILEDAKTRWSQVEVVGEQIDNGVTSNGDPTSPNARKKRGKVLHPGNLPFVHRASLVDGEMFENGLAQKHAEWVYRRGLFDAWAYTVTLNEHHQNGSWFESDTVAHCEDQELGVSGRLYVQAVKCSGSKQTADQTVLTLRKPGLLSAAFGEIPNPPVFRANSSTGTAKAAP